MQRMLALAMLATVTAFHAWPQPKIDSVVNAASFEKGLPAGGSLATAFCSGLPATPGATGYLAPGTYIASFPIPYELAGVRISVNGALAPILAVVATLSGQTVKAQINFQVPLDRDVSLVNPPTGFPGFLGIAPIADLQPLPKAPEWGGFFSDVSGYAVAQHASDYSRVTLENPARPGETIIAYGNDFFSVWPHPPVGSPVPLQPLFETLPPQYSKRGSGCLFLQDYPLPVGGQSIPSTPPLQTPFLGLAPGMIGVEQINFVVPANQQPGDWALFFNIGSCGLLPGERSLRGASSPYVKLPVR